MIISIIVEGKTESVFLPVLREFLQPRLAGRMPKINPFVANRRIAKEEELRMIVRKLLSGDQPSDAVIALTDVYTGSNDFLDASDAKEKMRQWVGNEPNFFPHAAQYDFEAWLIPYWADVQRLAGHNKRSPGANPETVNHQNPPSHHLKEIFLAGKLSRSYNKARDARSILRGKDLMVSINQCPELKALVNTILQLSGGETIP